MAPDDRRRPPTGAILIELVGTFGADIARPSVGRRGQHSLLLRGPWTAGVLANHIWSFAGDEDRPDISNTFAQPLVAYTWPSAWTLSVQSESTYNWETEQWSVPVNAALAKLVMFGKLPVSLQAYFEKSSIPGDATKVK